MMTEKDMNGIKPSQMKEEPQAEKKLQVHNLRISFRTSAGKVQAVRGINFDLMKGETLAIVGESGSGKSVTSKAILGIQAGNAITEEGEILYNGMDLLKIGEDDFYHLRGDKIAMIFQDPLSSLNPIMRIGKQLTEAMLLKSKARRKSSRKEFTARMSQLSKRMETASPEKSAEISRQIRELKELEKNSVGKEQAYQAARSCAEEAEAECENILYLIGKNAWKDLSDAKKVKEFTRRSVHPDVVTEEEYKTIREHVDSLTRGLRSRQKKGDFSDTEVSVQAIRECLKKALERDKPDYLEKTWQESGHSESLEDGFMKEFRACAETGIRRSDEEYTELRRKALKQLENGLETLTSGGPDALIPVLGQVCKAVDESIDPMDLVKDSMACTFTGNMKYLAGRWREGLRSNGRKEKKYLREKQRAEKRAARGKTWTVPAPTVIDMETVSSNMNRLISGLKEHYEEKIAEERTENKTRKTEQLIRDLEEKAAGMAAKMDKWTARNKALKLMEEVGISEPRVRYRQYPFEFSGGMRQRIVIAIALAADPDILICDEPTTALDVTIQAQILELINRLKEKRNLSIIFITHDLGVVANMADRIAVMYAGKIVEYGTSEEIFYSPAHPYTWALLSSMPDLDTKEKLEAIPGTPPNMIYPPKGDAFAERNRYAMEIDFEQEPPVFSISETHWAATWLLHPDAPKVDPPSTVTERIRKMKARAAEVTGNE